MRVVTLMQALLGLTLLAVIPVVGRGMAPTVTALHGIGGLGVVLAAALASVRVSQDREVDLWGWMAVAVATWIYVACFAVALNWTLCPVRDLVVGIVSSRLGIWVALRPPPSAAHQPGRIAGPTPH